MIGAQCLADLLTASVNTSGVLMQDYDAANGNEIITDVILNSDRSRVATLINLAMQIYFGACKLPEITTAPFPPILSNVLHAVLRSSETTIGTLRPSSPHFQHVTLLIARYI